MPKTAGLQSESAGDPHNSELLVSQDIKASLVYFALGLAGVALLGMATPWLKSFGSAVYVSASFAYLVALWLLLNWIAHRVRGGRP